MRYLILIASLALAGAAFADDKSTSTTRELDKSSPQLMTPGDSSDTTDSSATGRHDPTSGMPTGKRQHAAAPADAGSSSGASGGTRAQDYNSSRSNNSSARADTAGDLDQDGRPDVVTCRNGADNDCDDTRRSASPANHNTTRSNRTRAQDYNSSRSNNSSARLDPDSDGDSALKEVRCSMASDDCVSNAADDGNDLVLRKRPGR
jgi:hypothetical protein